MKFSVITSYLGILLILGLIPEVASGQDPQTPAADIDVAVKTANDAADKKLKEAQQQAAQDKAKALKTANDAADQKLKEAQQQAAQDKAKALKTANDAADKKLKEAQQQAAQDKAKALKTANDAADQKLQQAQQQAAADKAAADKAAADKAAAVNEERKKAEAAETARLVWFPVGARWGLLYLFILSAATGLVAIVMCSKLQRWKRKSQSGKVILDIEDFNERMEKLETIQENFGAIQSEFNERVSVYLQKNVVAFLQKSIQQIENNVSNIGNRTGDQLAKIYEQMEVFRGATETAKSEQGKYKEGMLHSVRKSAIKAIIGALDNMDRINEQAPQPIKEIKDCREAVLIALDHSDVFEKAVQKGDSTEGCKLRAPIQTKDPSLDKKVAEMIHAGYELEISTGEGDEPRVAIRQPVVDFYQLSQSTTDGDAMVDERESSSPDPNLAPHKADPERSVDGAGDK